MCELIYTCILFFLFFFYINLPIIIHSSTTLNKLPKKINFPKRTSIGNLAIIRPSNVKSPSNRFISPFAVINNAPI